MVNAIASRKDSAPIAIAASRSKPSATPAQSGRPALEGREQALVDARLRLAARSARRQIPMKRAAVLARDL
jgi:hypothetical protein